ncbi:MAG TPA: hypothetical protein VKB29_00385 [Candidatus Binataceae bacterium]|nr:hypothetical protein [Candidatus Binataceae bacterium]
MAIPMSASAGDWNRHEEIGHQAWQLDTGTGRGAGTILTRLRQLTFPRTRRELTVTRLRR